MESAKAVKASQFSFENLIGAHPLPKPRTIQKLTNQNIINPYTFEKSSRNLVPFPNNRSFPNVIPEKLRPWKNSPNLSVVSNEKKPIQANLKCQTKRLPLRMALPTPLTEKHIQSSHSNQPQPRSGEGFDSRPRNFRVRNGTSLGKTLTDQSARTLRSTSRCGREVSQCDVSVASFDSEMVSERKKNSDLGRVRMANINTFRRNLPLLVIHFEGILGTCLVQCKEETRENTLGKEGKEDPEAPTHIIRRGVKGELKALSTHFLVVVVFPSWEKKYRKVAKYLVVNGFHIDAMYHNAKKKEAKSVDEVGDFVLNYNLIVDDFQAKRSDKKILFLLPLNLNSKATKKEFLLRSSLNDLDDERGNNSRENAAYGESQFIHFFPKAKVNFSNMKIICVPNFILAEKNEKPSNLVKSSFAKTSKMVNFMLKEIIDPFKGMSAHKREENQVLSLPLTPIALNQGEYKHESALQSKHFDLDEQNLETENQENKEASKGSVGLYGIDMRGLLQRLEKVRERSLKWKKIQQIKQKGDLIEQENPIEFNLPAMKQKIIEGIVEAQKMKGEIKRNIMSHFLVGDLFSRNNYLFKFYEKDSFYGKKTLENITDMTEMLKKKKKEEKEKEKDMIVFTPRKEAVASLPTEIYARNGEGEDEIDSLDLIMIKKQVRNMQLYLGD